MSVLDFYNRFIPNLALLLSPIYVYLSKYYKNVKEMEWSDDIIAAFDTVKTALAESYACVD